MIREIESGHYLICVTQIVPQIFVIGNPGNHDDFLGIDKTRFRNVIYAFRLSILNRCKKQSQELSVGTFTRSAFNVIFRQVKSGCNSLLFSIVHILRAFADYQNIRLVNPLGEITQTAKRQQHVFVHQPVVVHKHYIQIRMQTTILECIVKKDVVCRRKELVPTLFGIFFAFQQFRMAEKLGAFHSVLVHSHRHGRELAFYLKRLVPEHIRTPINDNLLKSFAFALVAS